MHDIHSLLDLMSQVDSVHSYEIPEVLRTNNPFKKINVFRKDYYNNYY